MDLEKDLVILRFKWGMQTHELVDHALVTVLPSPLFRETRKLIFRVVWRFSIEEEKKRASWKTRMRRETVLVTREPCLSLLLDLTTRANSVRLA